MKEIVKKTDHGSMVMPTKMTSMMKVGRVSDCRYKDPKT